MSQFLDSDGYINVAEFIALARDIDRLAAKEGLKPKEVYFSKKAIVKIDHPSSAKLDATAFAKKRAQPIKSRARMPASGSRVRMMVWLRNYKDLEQYEDFYHDYQQAVKAIERHTAKAEKVLEQIKVKAAKLRESANTAFDKNLNCFLNEVLPEDAEYVIGTSMMGKTVIVKLPNGGYVSIGKSDEDKYLKAVNAASEKPAAKTTRKPATKAPVKKVAAKAPARTAKPVAKAVAKPTAFKRAR
jgi:hypothetical protein